ncbi:hypothetical protein ACFSM7_08240 [Clavibacter michiganensis subsp. tessellarius]|uniref:hypothetical protein n=1 Tax=Clavibacter tessellarius TaxID=31965 RepID=UPI003632E2A1
MGWGHGPVPAASAPSGPLVTARAAAGPERRSADAVPAADAATLPAEPPRG